MKKLFVFWILFGLLLQSCIEDDKSKPKPKPNEYGIEITTKYTDIWKRLPIDGEIIKYIGKSNDTEDELYVIKIMGECFIVDEEFGLERSTTIKLNICPEHTKHGVAIPSDTVYITKTDTIKDTVYKKSEWDF